LLSIVVLGGIAWWLARNDAPTTLDRPLSDFAVPDTAGVTRIFITDTKGGGSVDLKRTPNGWILNDMYEAKQAEMDLLLRTFKRVEVKSPVPKSLQPKTLRVMASMAKKVEIYEGGDKPSKVWIVGHGTQDHFGTFMVLEKPGIGRSNAPFIMGMGGFTGILSTRFHTKVDHFRSAKFFGLADMRDLASVQLETPAAPMNGYTIAQDINGRYSLKDFQGRPYPFDTVLVAGAVLPLKQTFFESIKRLPKASRDSLLGSTPNHVLTITKRDGEVTRAKFWFRPYKGEEPPFGMPRPLYDPTYMDALVQDDTLHVQMQRPAFERILQPISSFRP
ncbi:MAG: hypothetical protein KF797_11540, partial [Flavobacteriales bacterium]|nr:hypothetical protein [Flavobacteriales bacterium]